MSASQDQPIQEALFTDAGLIGGQCAACGRRHFPLAGTCPWDGSRQTIQVTLANEGTLWAWTAVTAPPPGYEGDVPYGFGVVELAADGLQVIARLTESDPALLNEGMPMRFTVVPLSPGTTTWAYAPA